MTVVSNAAAAPSSTDDVLRTAPKTLGQDDFLKLFIAELKYQDPLSPMNDREFMAQLTAFSTLEQLIQLNAKIAEMQQAILAIRDKLGGTPPEPGPQTDPPIENQGG
ncbi:MAG: hypothetical protein IMW86_00300 [Hydrogenibacillus sp.]|nr:hypothetical protein [Hydrogenibacillus sp.]